MALPINHTDLDAHGAKKLATKALELQAVYENTVAFVNTTLASVNTVANTGLFTLTVALPAGLNNLDITNFFTGLGYSIQVLSGGTSLVLDWQNPASKANALRNRGSDAFEDEPQER